MFILSTQLSISAAHYLDNYEGNCARLHGHNWKIKVSVTANELNNLGMALDFKDLKEICWKSIGMFDHKVFNEVEPFDKINPTAENLAKHFYHAIAKELPSNIKMHKIHLWETDKYEVEYGE